MTITGGFGMAMDLQRGSMRRWYMGRDGVKRWSDNDDPIDTPPRDDKRDAERYRWLRERDLDTIKQGGVFAGMTPANVVLNGPDLDSAIDAAMTYNAYWVAKCHITHERQAV